MIRQFDSGASHINLPVKCKYCGKSTIIKFGSYKGVPRYFCTSCKRKFKDDDHMFHMRVPASCVVYVLTSYYTGTTIKGIREDLCRKFNYYPSRATIHLWIDKYTDMAVNMLQNHHPETSEIWILNEIILNLSRQKLFFYEVVDAKTNFILDFITFTGEGNTIRTLIRSALEKSSIKPELIMAYMPAARFALMEKATRLTFQHVPKETYADRNRIGISGNSFLYDIKRYRLKNPHRFKKISTATDFFQGTDHSS